MQAKLAGRLPTEHASVLSPWYFPHTSSNPYFKCLKSPNIFSLWSSHFASIQRNTPNKCFHHTFLQVKAEGSSHEDTSAFTLHNLLSHLNCLVCVLIHWHWLSVFFRNKLAFENLPNFLKVPPPENSYTIRYDRVYLMCSKSLVYHTE